jgi:uncharacterized protein
LTSIPSTAELPTKPPAKDAAPAEELAGPVTGLERISSIDILRGVAVLGILLMNINSFGLPEGADDNPTRASGANAVDQVFWFVNQVLFEGKMRAIFSMLFGAGVIILTSRIEKRAHAGAADIYYRRTLWLIGMGLAHALFLWNGDILYVYGTAGLILYPFRRWPSAALIAAGVVLLASNSVRARLEDQQIETVRAQAAEADAAEANGAKLTAEQQQAQEDWADKRKELEPTQSDIDKDIATHRDSYAKLFRERFKDLMLSRPGHPSGGDFADAAGMMFIGMGLMKLGVFAASRSRPFYRIMMTLGYGIGIPLNAYVGVRVMASSFSPIDHYLLQHASYDLGRLSVALGHIGLVMLLCQRQWAPRLQKCLAYVGRMALTNYLLQSLICTIIFDGWGFGLFARLGRGQLLIVVLGVWAFELALSPIWFRFFRFGPVEWAWRSLTYWQRQPFLR